MTVAAPAPLSIRQRVEEQAFRIKRVKLMDRFAVGFITFGGLFIIVAVLFIFVFILAEALPLFRSATGSARGVVNLAAVPAALGVPADPGKPLVMGTDEYQMFFYELLSDGRTAFFKADGSFVREFMPALLPPSRVASASRSLTDNFVAIGTDDGRVLLQQIRFQPRYQDQKLVDLDLEVKDRGLVALDAARRPIREIAYDEKDGRKTAIAVAGDDEILVYRTDDEGVEHRAALKTRDGERVARVRIGRSDTLIAATEQGNLYHWELLPELRLTEVVKVSSEPITAIEYSLGNITALVGDARGNLSAWFRVRLREEDTDLKFVKAHEYPSQGVAIAAIGPSTRDKSFVTAGADGSLVLRHMTSGRSLIAFPATGAAMESVLLTPKMDGIIAKQSDGRLARYEISSPHPEVSWQALFGKVWYEGYSKPEYVWQSTGGTDDFETKFSLVPLIFGTIKGTLYALLFAIPLAILGALYTSQFMRPSLKARVKPTVEIMAALPSVVLGFLAGLWLAPRVEKVFPGLVLMLVFLPLSAVATGLLWRALPQAIRGRFRMGAESVLHMAAAAVTIWASVRLGAVFESLAFRGSFPDWLREATGLHYDQRNAIVVGLAMGFAVIPIIFSIAEEAFSNVPRNLTAASLALGADRWQTVTRVVLPTASPGIFSAIMIGFGRAVGETMIVLMATGNTPIMDWSPFNGFRTLSANIAVEIPEAPHGGTLYRTLFLAALMLFVLTFVVNTFAEIVRHRLRRRYSQS